MDLLGHVWRAKEEYTQEMSALLQNIAKKKELQIASRQQRKKQELRMHKMEELSERFSET